MHWLRARRGDLASPGLGVSEARKEAFVDTCDHRSEIPAFDRRSIGIGERRIVERDLLD